MTTLLVASTGGHLNQLVRLAPRLIGIDDDVRWVANDSVQSRSLLAGEQVTYVPFQPPRDIPAALANARKAWPILRSGDITTVVSTGSALALAFLPLAASLGMSTHYIESCTRVSGPSATGRILVRIPGIQCYTQHPDRSWPGRWAYQGSLLDGYCVEQRTGPPCIRRAVVTVGTWKKGFRRMVERMVALLGPDVETFWQTGSTDVGGLGIHATPWSDPTDLAEAMRRADLVVTHAGTGSSLDALDAGKTPVVVPRTRIAGECVDEHQAELAGELDRRSFAVASTPSDLTMAMLRKAAGRRVTSISPPTFELIR